jgi:glycosyl hydrolase family 114
VSCRSGPAAGVALAAVTLLLAGACSRSAGAAPAAAVRIVDRGRGDEPVPGRYNIRYVNGFQTQAYAVAYARLLVAAAHARHLAIGQKNTPQLGQAGRTDIGFDFAIAEECAEYDECQDYVDAYGDHVIVIEYRDRYFRDACSGYGPTQSIVERDRDVTAPGSPTYVFASC